MAEEVVILDGREFAVGDYVLVKWTQIRRWWRGRIVEIRTDGRRHAIMVRQHGTDLIHGANRLYPCLVSEVHSIRENFA
jgi:hypothetical protein